MVRKYQLRSPLERRTWVIVHGSLLRGHCSSKVCEMGGLGSCVCFAVGCRCAMADSVWGRGTATLGTYRRGYLLELPRGQSMICSHSPPKGSLWVRCHSRTRFLISCRTTILIVASQVASAHMESKTNKIPLCCPVRSRVRVLLSRSGACLHDIRPDDLL